MKLSSLIPSEAILAEFEATDKRAALKEMLEALSGAGRISAKSVPGLVKALMAREKLGSTGIGKGVAVPHVSHESVQDLVGAFGRSTGGIDFAALDGQPVHLVFLILASKESSGRNLEALARVAKLVRDDRFCRFLREAKGGKELAELLVEADVEAATG